MKAESLVKGTLILTLAALTARVLGIVQRVPLQHLLDDAGMATYGIAYNLYFMLLIVAVAGMPTAISKLVGGQLAQGDLAAARRTYGMALRFGWLSGGLIALALVAGASWYANVVGVPEARAAIWMVAPAMLIFPVIAMMRGWYQGHQYATPSGHSQIVEQIFRVASTVGLAYLGIQLGLSEEPVVAMAAFGGMIGGLGALLILWRARKKIEPIQQEALSQAAIAAAPAGTVSELQGSAGLQAETPGSAKPLSYRDLFKLSVPVSIAALAVPMMYFLDSSLIIPLLQDSVGYLQAKATVGIMTARAQTLAALPPILAIALSASVVPIIAAAAARGDEKELADKADQANRLALLAATPLIITLILATPMINRLVFGNDNGNLLIMVMIAGSIFQISMTVSNGLLNGLGRTAIPMVHVLAGIAVKLAGSVLLAPDFGIYGIIASTMLAFAFITLLNRLRLKKLIRLRSSFSGSAFRLYAGSLIIGISGLWGLWALVQSGFADGIGNRYVRDLIYLLITGGYAGATFGALYMFGKVLRTAEWERIVPARLRKFTGRWFRAATE